MTSELDIFVGNTTLIDEDVYRLWLDGYSGLCTAVRGIHRTEHCFVWDRGGTRICAFFREVCKRLGITDVEKLGAEILGGL